MYVNSSNRHEYETAISFRKRIEKFKNSLRPGMSLKVYPSTDNQTLDRKSRFAKIQEIYNNYVLLEDDNGFKYGPTYAKLLEWGNV